MQNEEKAYSIFERSFRQSNAMSNAEAPVLTADASLDFLQKAVEQFGKLRADLSLQVSFIALLADETPQRTLALLSEFLGSLKDPQFVSEPRIEGLWTLLFGFLGESTDAEVLEVCTDILGVYLEKWGGSAVLWEAKLPVLEGVPSRAQLQVEGLEVALWKRVEEYFGKLCFTDLGPHVPYVVANTKGILGLRHFGHSSGK